MSLTPTDRTPCRTPNADGVTNIPTWKFQAVREAILTVMAEEPNGVSFTYLRASAKTKVNEETLETLGSWGWHFTSVKLEMEVAGDIARVEGASPQKLVLVPK